MTPKPFLASLSLAALFLSGCNTARPLYYWGSYETIAYLGYAKPDKATLLLQQEKLEADVQACTGGYPGAHPGLHAQLGYVYFQLGRVDDAVRQFQAEKTLFPESSQFMDRMIEKAKGAKTT